VESFRDSLRLLKPDGIQVTAFAVRQPWIATRFYEALRVADKSEPVVVHELGTRTAGLLYISGPGKPLDQVKPRPADLTAVLLTDDWPFTYAEHRAIPGEYLITLALILLLSIFCLRLVAGQRGLPNWHFFCLGAGFLLLETKNVTTLALVFGSTWYVNSVVFLTILCMALLSSVITSLTDRIRLSWAYAGLFLAIGLNYFLPLQDFAGADFLTRLVLVGGATALPVFFSGFVFAHSFKRAADPAHALGSNVLGGVVGGIVEYTSMVMGLRFLFYLIAGFYALSILALGSANSAAKK
jgi:hypothetical protein